MNGADCGTTTGYHRHRTVGETPCGPCKEAWADYMTEYRARRPAYRARSAQLSADRTTAYQLLAARHPGDFKELLDHVRAQRRTHRRTP